MTTEFFYVVSSFFNCVVILTKTVVHQFSILFVFFSSSVSRISMSSRCHCYVRSSSSSFSYFKFRV